MNTSLQKIASCLLVCSLLTTGAGAANKKTVKPTKPKPKKNTELTLIEAYTQRTIGGAAGSAPPPSGTFIVVRWDRQDSIPLGFFWRGENGYLPCQIARAHKAQFKDPKNAPPGLEYFQSPIGNGMIRPGDTLLLTPLTRAKFMTPAEVPASAKNILYYKVSDTKLNSLSVPVITKKKDVVLP